MPILIALIFAVAFAFSASGQAPVLTQPYPVTTTNASSTIGVTNTFQRIWAQSTNTRGRAGCTVQNTGTNAMYVYFGALANAMTPISLKLSAGQSVNCNSGGTVAQDEISITGTAGETFYAGQQ